MTVGVNVGVLVGARVALGMGVALGRGVLDVVEVSEAVAVGGMTRVAVRLEVSVGRGVFVIVRVKVRDGTSGKVVVSGSGVGEMVSIMVGCGVAEGGRVAVFAGVGGKVGMEVGGGAVGRSWAAIGSPKRALAKETPPISRATPIQRQPATMRC